MEDIHHYIAHHDAPEKADYLLDEFENIFDRLVAPPQRGIYPKELIALGIREYREIFFKPYRIIYRINKDCVYILLMTDGRRDMQTLLQRRLLQG